MVTKGKFFLCKETFVYKFEENVSPNHSNTFTAAVSWSCSPFTAYHGNFNSNKREFTGGKIYQLSIFSTNGFSLYDNWGNMFDVEKYGCGDKFIEVKIELSEEEEKTIKKIEDKGFEVNILPIAGVYNKETNSVDNVAYSIIVSDRKIRSGWIPLGSVWLSTNNIANGLSKAMRKIMQKAEGPWLIEQCLHGNYSYYICRKNPNLPIYSR